MQNTFDSRPTEADAKFGLVHCELSAASAGHAITIALIESAESLTTLPAHEARIASDGIGPTGGVGLHARRSFHRVIIRRADTEVRRERQTMATAAVGLVARLSHVFEGSTDLPADAATELAVGDTERAGFAVESHVFVTAIADLVVGIRGYADATEWAGPRGQTSEIRTPAAEHGIATAQTDALILTFAERADRIG